MCLIRVVIVVRISLVGFDQLSAEKDRDRHIERAEEKEMTRQRELSNVDARGSKTYACCLALSLCT